MEKKTRTPGTRRKLIVSMAAVVVVLIAGGLYWFQPWKLFTNNVVNEALPSIAAAAAVPSSSASPSLTLGSLPPAQSSTAALPVTDPATAAVVPTSPASPKFSVVKPAPPTAAASAQLTAQPKSTAPAQAVLLSNGQFISHEHDTTGSVELIRLANGHRVLALKDLNTSNGPALHVWLTNAPVIAGSSGWRVFDEGLHLDLGDLKGNIGNQVYSIADDVDLTQYSSVTVWCARFSVSFGAAQLHAA